MSSYIFPGYPTFLNSAAADLGHPEAASLASRIVPMTDLANLCAQAAIGDPSHVEGILAKAVEFRDQIAVALRAADLMIADVERGRSGASLEARPESEAPRLPPPMPDPRRGRKVPMASREAS